MATTTFYNKKTRGLKNLFRAPLLSRSNDFLTGLKLAARLISNNVVE